MKNKILHLMVAFLTGLSGLMAQTIELETVTAPPGPVTVDLNLSGFAEDVGAITLKIAYDEDLLTYTGGNFTYGGANIYVGTNTEGLLQMSWFSLSGFDVNSQPITLNFDYDGGLSSALAFAEVEIADIDGNAFDPITQINGSVNPAVPVGAIALANTTANVGSTVEIAISATADPGELTNVTAIDFYVGYNPAQLSYQGITNSLPGMIANANNGVVSIRWSNMAGIDLSSATLPGIEFVYQGGGVASLAFNPGSQVVSEMGDIEIVQFIGGSVQVDPAGPFDATLTIAEVATSDLDDIEVPLSLSDALSAGAIDLSITFDASKLEYKGYTADQLSGWITFNEAGLVRFIKTSTNAMNLIAGDLLSLRFDKLTGDLANISFAAGNMILDEDAIALAVDFEDGFITAPLNLTITVDNATREYGAADPAFAFQDFSAQLIAGHTMDDVIGVDGVEFTLATTDQTSAVATYTDEIGIDPATIDGSVAYIYQITIVNGALEISPKALTPQITAYDKCYDGNTDAELETQSLDGILFDDDVSLEVSGAAFASAEPGTHAVTATGLSLNGADASNYELDATDATTTATINALSTYAFDYTMPSPTYEQTQYTVAVNFATDVEGCAGYDGVRFKIDATGPGTVTFGAEDSNSNYFTFDNNGFWGPEAGFDLPAVYNATTNWDIEFSEAGEYQITFSLIEAPDGALIADITMTVNVTVDALYTISGVVKYANTTGAVRPINSNETSTTQVILYASDGTTEIDRVDADINGAYLFENVPAGDYVVTAVTDKAWGGLNVLDDIRFRNHINGSNPLIGILLNAADVDNNDIVNSFDGIRLRNRITQGSTVGWNRPDWNFQNAVIQITSTNSITDILGVCTGDINASFTPSL